MTPGPRGLRVAVTVEQCWHRVPGGTATSLLGSLRALRGGHPELDLVGVSAWHRDAPAPHLAPPVRVAQLRLPRPALYEAWHRLRAPAVEWATGPVDVVHATGMAVPPATAPLVVTVHDLAFLADRTRATTRGQRFFERSIELARCQADLVVVPSEATRRECVEHGFDASRVVVVPWGADLDPAPSADVDAVRRRHRLDRPYVLWLGTVEPRKNLDGLLAAWRCLDRHDTDLVLAGPDGWGVDLDPLLAGARGVRRIGAVAQHDLAALHAGAAVFCLPSHREGFGLPVIDAMAQGVPVVTSRGTATEEVAGEETGRLVEPTDTGMLAAALADLLDDPAERARCGAAALRRAQGFTWAATADRLAEAYGRAASEPVRRVGVNLLWLVPGEVGGTETYATRMVDAWHRSTQRPDLDLVVLANGRLAAAHPEVAATTPTLVAPVDGRGRVCRVLVENVWMPWTAWRQRLDLLHHLGGTSPAVNPVPSVLTVHDLQPLSHPETFHPMKRTWLRWALPRSVRRATIVSTLSRFVADDVRERLGVAAERVLVVPPGFDAAGSGGATDAATAPGDAAVLDRYDLAGRRFVLYPAITYPHKNHAVLVDALALLADDPPAGGGPGDPVLVLTGGSGDAEAALAARIARAGVGRQVRRTGRIPAAHLEVLYRHAAALVYPSRYEGFGLPVLEAMDQGCPVIAADDTGLHEVVGEAGLLVPPDDPAAWAAAIREVFGSPARATDLVGRGRARVRQFSWETSAAALARVYDAALATRHPRRARTPDTPGARYPATAGYLAPDRGEGPAEAAEPRGGDR